MHPLSQSLRLNSWYWIGFLGSPSICSALLWVPRPLSDARWANIFENLWWICLQWNNKWLHWCKCYIFLNAIIHRGGWEVITWLIVKLSFCGNWYRFCFWICSSMVYFNLFLFINQIFWMDCPCMISATLHCYFIGSDKLWRFFFWNYETFWFLNNWSDFDSVVGFGKEVWSSCCFSWASILWEEFTFYIFDNWKFEISVIQTSPLWLGCLSSILSGEQHICQVQFFVSVTWLWYEIRNVGLLDKYGFSTAVFSF